MTGSSLPHPAAHLVQSPYPGLRPFEEQDHGIFFGREEQVIALIRRLEEYSLVAVVGSSGSGKSSLVRAGLLPAVRRGFLKGTKGWLIVPPIKPGREPYDRLAKALIQCRPAVRSPAVQDGDLPAILRETDRGLLDALDRTGLSADTRVLVVVDQFEELFAFRIARTKSEEVASRDEASAFVNMLLRSCEGDGRVSLVLTMRSDFIGHCEAFLGLPEEVSRSQFLVPRLDRTQMEETISGPTRIVHQGFAPFDFEEGVVNRIINDAGDRPDQLPLLQHALMRSWKRAVQRAAEDRTAIRVKHEDYTQTGGIENALSQDANAAWAEIPEKAKKATARQLFLLLCDVSADGQITRRRPRVADVELATGASGTDIEDIVRVFQADDRDFLLPPLNGEPLASKDLLDISHEALLRQWGRFAEWLADERRDAEELLRLARQADLARQGFSELLGGDSLARIADWRKRVNASWARRYVDDEVWSKVLKFINDSEDAARARKREAARSARQKRWLIVGVGLLLVAATLVSLWFALLQRQATAAANAAAARAEAATREAQSALEKWFIGTIRDKSPSAEERETLWALAQLESKNGAVRHRVLEHWFSTHDTLRVALSEKGRGLRAIVGMNRGMLRAAQQHADKLATRLTRELMRPHAPRKRAMVAGLKELVPLMSVATANELATTLVGALQQPSLTDSDRSNAADAVAALAPRIDPPQAATLAATLAQALEQPAETDRARLYSLSEALVGLAPRIDEPQASALAAKLVTALLQPGEMPRARLVSLTDSVNAFAPRISQTVAGEQAANLIQALLQPIETNVDRLSYLSGAFASVAPRVDAIRATHLASLLIKAIAHPTATDLGWLSALSDGVEALAPRVDPTNAAKLLDESSAAFEQIPIADSKRWSAMTGVMAALGARVDATQSAGLAVRLAEDLAQQSGTDSHRLVRVTDVLVALPLAELSHATPQPAELAAGFAKALVQQDETDPDRLSVLTEGLVILAPRLDSRHVAELATALGSSLQQSTETDEDRLIFLVEALRTLSGRLSAAQATQVAKGLANAWQNPDETHSSRSRHLPDAWVALAPRMDAQQAGALAARLSAMLRRGSETDEYRLRYFAAALAALAPRIDPEVAAKLAAGLTTALQRPTEDDEYRVAGLAAGIAALAPCISTMHLARLAAGLGRALEQPNEADSSRLSSLADALAALASDLDEAHAAKIAAGLTNALQLQSETDSWSPRPPHLSKALASLAPRLDATEAAKMSTALTNTLAQPSLTDSKRLSSLSNALAALAPRLDQARAGDVGARLVETMAQPTETNAERLAEFTRVLVSLAPHLDSAQRDAVTADLAEAFLQQAALLPRTDQDMPAQPPPAANTPKTNGESAPANDEANITRLLELAQTVAALGLPHDSPLVTDVTAALVRALEQPTEDDSERLSRLSGAVAALGPRLTEVRAAELASELARVVARPTETKSDRLTALTETIPQLASHTSEALRAGVAATLVKALKDPQTTDPVRLEALATALAQIAQSIGTEKARQTMLLALSNLLLRPVSDEDESARRQQIVGLLTQLPRDDLAEVLKWPFCVGESEHIVLAQLQTPEYRPHGGMIRFVERAELFGITEADRPAKRPRVDTAQTELEALSGAADRRATEQRTRNLGAP